MVRKIYYNMLTRTCFLKGHGSKIVSGSGDKTIKVWDVSTGACLRTLQGHTDYVFSVCVSPDGSKIVSGSGDKTIKVWD